ERVKLSGADLIQPRTLERNLRFDTPDSSLTLAGRVLRLRQDADVRLTYKDSSEIIDGVLTRREIEFVADDFAAAKRFFEALGYQVCATYEKYRSIFNLGDLHICIDEMPYGNFAEIEGAYTAQIQAAADLLRLDWSKRINESYLGLFERLKENQGFNFNDLSFENFQGIRIDPQALGVSPADQEN
ncbi:MAG: class IV adenylate cyclase, partial [Chloroflexota bacterium]